MSALKPGDVVAIGDTVANHNADFDDGQDGVRALRAELAYAQRRRAVDAEFADDLETALRKEGYEPPAVGPLDDEALLRVDEAAQGAYGEAHPGDDYSIRECRAARLRAVAEAGHRAGWAERDEAVAQLAEIENIAHAARGLHQLDATAPTGVRLARVVVVCKEALGRAESARKAELLLVSAEAEQRAEAQRLRAWLEVIAHHAADYKSEMRARGALAGDEVPSKVPDAPALPEPPRGGVCAGVRAGVRRAVWRAWSC